MNKILNLFKVPEHLKNSTYIKPQKLVDLKRKESIVNFIHPGHPLYDNTVSKEENKLHILAPNETAYNETSLLHSYVAIVTYEDNNYLLIKSLKHFKEQSIGGLLQFDETIYEIIPFFENEEEYQTANSYIFHETYEYDHPVENYFLLAEENNHTAKLSVERGKKPIMITMIDSMREFFTDKLSQEQIELIDYVITPAQTAYDEIQNNRK